MLKILVCRARWKPPDSRLLSNYSAGALWTPPKERETVDLHKEYTLALESIVQQNQSQLAKHFGLHSMPNSQRTFRTIVNQLQTEFYGPPHESTPIAHSHCPAKLYNAFLRHLYTSPPKFAKVFAVLADFPQPAARYIHPTHLQDMLKFSRLFGDSNAYLSVVEELERVSYNFGPFKRAEVLLMMAKAGRPVKSRMVEKFTAWRSHFAMGDLRTLNVLFSAGLEANSAEVQSFVLEEIESHNLKPDRFTYQCLLRRARNNPLELKATFREFCDQGHVIDVTILYTMLQGLLHSGYISAAENLLHQLLRSHRSAYTLPQNPNKLSMLLWMVDRARQLANSPTEATQMVSLVPSEKILVAFADKYIELGEFAKLCDMMKSLADHGYPARNLIYRASKAFRHQWTVKEFDVFLALVLDIASDLPLMTEPLAKNLDKLNTIFRPTAESIYDLCLACK